MSALPRRVTRPLPTATVVVVAVLVALASALADANGVGSLGTRELDVRVAARLVFPGRALASALSTVAEGLQDDWTAGRRAPTSGAGGFALAGLAAHAGFDLRPSLVSHEGERFAEPFLASDARASTHRRLLNLPPPTAATCGA